MAQVKDPAIKLFGKTIQLLNDPQLCCAEDIKETFDQDHAIAETEETSSNPRSEEFIDPSTSSRTYDDPKTPTAEKETSSKTTQPTSDEKPQKPDKILPCPRCNSMDTKFCYYNNYNVNQPRHFCKNCQRYWTNGGTMRNTPVGSGRRKNKSASSASYYRHLIVSEALQGSLTSNGSVLSFGSDHPLCESMNSALSFSDKSQKSEDDHSMSASNSIEKGGNNNGVKNFQGYPLQVPCFTPHWQPYPVNSGQFPPPAPPGSGVPVSFYYPTPQYWGCIQPRPWSMPTSPLGKHSRDGNLLSPSSTSTTGEFLKENDVLIPKTLRINNQNEAAQSSLWTTLGILKEDDKNSINGGNLRKAFQSKSDWKDKNEVADNSMVNLLSNPAALSRSLNFRETT